MVWFSNVHSLKRKDVSQKEQKEPSDLSFSCGVWRISFMLNAVIDFRWVHLKTREKNS